MLWLSLNYASHGHKESELKYIISINKAGKIIATLYPWENICVHSYIQWCLVKYIYFSVNKLAAVIGVVIGAVILVIIVFIIGLVCYGKLMM